MTSPSPDERLEELQRTIADYPRRVAELSQRVTETAKQTVTGEAGNGMVVATVTGGGEVQGVRVTHRALRELDNRTLAGYVMSAVNSGLERADALIAAVRDSAGDGRSDVEDALGRYERKMDDLLYQLDRIDRSLDRFED